LHEAARLSNTDVARYLIEQGAPVNARAKNNITPLHCAATGSDPLLQALFIEPGPQVVELLVKNGAEINAKDAAGWTPLHFAVKFGRNLIVASLLQNGADAGAMTNDGLTPLSLVRDPKERDDLSAIFQRHHRH
jgi:ankyrin